MDRQETGREGPEESPVGRPRSPVWAKAGWTLLLALEMVLIALWGLYGRHMAKWDLRGNVSADHPLAPFVYNGIWLVLLMLGILAGVLHGWAKEERILSRGLQEYRDWKRGKGPAD